MSEAVIETRRLCKRYRTALALDDVSLEVRPGERLALLGHNGAGKTTLIKLVLGLTRPSAGSVRVLGHVPGTTRGGAWRRAVGFLPESVAFPDALTGLEMLRFYARLKREPRRRAEALLERVGLGAAARHRIKTYSKGMRQRLGLAQALIGRPRLLLLDEPTTGLDPTLRRAFFAIVRELKDEGTTVVLSSHILTELEARTDRVAILRRGRLVAVGTLDELRLRAGLPARVRLATEGDPRELVARLGPRFAPARQNDHAIEIEVPAAQRRGLFHAMIEAGVPIDDIEVMLPSLEDVYAHFGHDERAL